MRSPRYLFLLSLSLLAAACASGGEGSGGASAKVTCAALPAPDPALSRQMDPEAVDQWLVDAAILDAVNRERCRRRIAPLAADPALARAASMHSGDMVRHGFFDHASPVEGRASLRQRAALAGAAYPRLAENLAEMPLFDTADRHVFVLDRAACRFALSPNGPALPRFSYAQAGQAAVDIWMDSSGHRRNLLSPELTRHGAGAAIRPDPEKCGQLVIVQDFAGPQ